MSLQEVKGNISNMSLLMLGEIYMNMARTQTPQETSHLQFELVVLAAVHQF